MRFLVPLIAALVLVGAAPIATAEAAPGGYSASSAAAAAPPAKASFGAGPASAQKLDGRPYFSYDATPGGSIEDHIAVINFAAHPQTLNVYPVDAVNGTNGAFAYAARAAPRTQVGAWLTVGMIKAGEITVAPRTVEILPIYLRVPSNASPGDHVGAVIVSLTGLLKGKNKQLVKFEQRIATRVIIRVSGPLHPRLSIENLHASYSGHLDPFASGAVTVTYTVRNTGNVLLGASQHISAHGLFGSSGRAPALAGIPLLLPGGSYRVSTRVPGVLPEISVTVAVRLGPEGLRGDINPGLHVISASVTLWTVPWILVALVIILLLVIIALIWRRRRRSPAPGRVGVQTPEGVKS
jgi:Bacterial protein of unknown function (DUF916)